SISMTLSHSVTKMWIEFFPREKEIVSEVFLDGKENESFKSSLLKRLLRLQNEMPWLLEYSLKIDSQNTFPHSAGIASSASSMAALSFALYLHGDKEGEEFSLEK